MIFTYLTFFALRFEVSNAASHTVPSIRNNERNTKLPFQITTCGSETFHASSIFQHREELIA